MSTGARASASTPTRRKAVRKLSRLPWPLCTYVLEPAVSSLISWRRPMTCRAATDDVCFGTVRVKGPASQVRGFEDRERSRAIAAR